MVALDNVNEGAVVVDGDQIVMNNACVKLMFGLDKEDLLNWKVQDLLKGNEHLLEIYEKVVKGVEEQEYLMNTVLVTKNSNRAENLIINFKCVSIKTTKGQSGNILILFQPVVKP